MNVIQKSEAIKNGLRKGFQDGSSKMAKRKCYGYTISSVGELEINPDEAKVVSWIFERYGCQSSALPKAYAETDDGCRKCSAGTG